MEKEKYKAYSYKLNKKTADLLKKIKELDGKSWNLFIYKLLCEHINNNKNTYRNELFKPVYSKFLKDKCEKCGVTNGYKAGKYLVVHHIDANIVNNSKKNLITLCQSCHGKQYPR